MLTLIAASILSKDKTWKRITRAHVAVLAILCFVYIELLSCHEARLLRTFKVPGPPPLAVELLLLIGAFLSLAVGVFHVVRVLRRGSWKQRAACAIPTFVFLSIILLAVLAPLSRYSRAYASSILWYLRGHEGRAIFIGPRGTSEINYRNRVRHGVWREWDANGKLVHQCEYRNGKPWEGLCQIYDLKAYLGEFKQGKPWTGYLKTPGTDKLDFYLDGVVVSREEYGKSLGMDATKYDFVGLWAYPKSESQLVDEQSTINPVDSTGTTVP